MSRVAIMVIDTPMPFRDRDDAAVPLLLVYVGPSMYPTFRDLDLLGIREDPAVRVGDVIAFRSPAGNRTLVHRVTGVAAGHYVTRGDSNRLADPFPVPPCSVLGRVRTCTRGGRERPVLRGRPGLAFANARRAVRSLSRGFGAAAGLAYSRAVASGAVSRWTTPLFRLDLVAVPRRGGTAYLVRHRARVIGVGSPGGGGWRLRFPYALLIDADRVWCALPEQASVRSRD